MCTFASSLIIDWEIVLQFCTLATTIFFTYQLVANDNRREERSEKERIKAWAKNAYKGTKAMPGLLQSVGKNLRRKFPGRVPLLIEAFEEMNNEGTDFTSCTTNQFLEYMAGVDGEHWPKWYDWPSKISSKGKLGRAWKYLKAFFGR